MHSVALPGGDEERQESAGGNRVGERLDDRTRGLVVDGDAAACRSSGDSDGCWAGRGRRGRGTARRRRGDGVAEMA